MRTASKIALVLPAIGTAWGQTAAEPFWMPRVTPLDVFNGRLVASVRPGAAANTAVTVLAPLQTADVANQAWVDSLTVTVVDMVTLSMNYFHESIKNLGGINTVTSEIVSRTLSGACTLDPARTSARCSGAWAVTHAIVESGKAGAITISSSTVSSTLVPTAPVDRITVAVTAGSGGSNNNSSSNATAVASTSNSTPTSLPGTTTTPGLGAPLNATVRANAQLSSPTGSGASLASTAAGSVAIAATGNVQPNMASLPAATSPAGPATADSPRTVAGTMAAAGSTTKGPTGGGAPRKTQNALLLACVAAVFGGVVVV